MVSCVGRIGLTAESRCDPVGSRCRSRLIKEHTTPTADQRFVQRRCLTRALALQRVDETDEHLIDGVVDRSDRDARRDGEWRSRAFDDQRTHFQIQ